MWWRKVWRRCAACGGVCHWHEDHWVCDQPSGTWSDFAEATGCGAEWNSDHDPKYAAPGGN